MASPIPSGRTASVSAWDDSRETLAAAKDQTPTVICQRLAAKLEEFQVGAQADDTAVVAMRFNG